MTFSSTAFRSLLGGVAVAFLATGALAAGPHEAPMRQFAKSTVKAWITNPTLIRAIKAQNKRHANLTQLDIIRLDKRWRAETDSASRPLIKRVLATALSKFLVRAKFRTQGLVTEVFVMDNKGLNVGQSDVTSDYWQGDEAKWKMTYLRGPGALFIDEVDKDESSQTFQSQLSMSIIDPETGEVIGSITVGMDVSAFL